ncbi:hypothetical protein DL93DRAFT_2231139 [Clavulina sp. PMI_390]|nr:hypothetical protein DL93DRAFT_2231139 [Clavulina sp. PMI_390]
MNNLPALARLPVFGVALLFSLIVLGIDADYDHKYSKIHQIDLLGFPIGDYLPSPSFPKVGIATAVLTMVSLGPMLVIDLIRKGSVTSFIAVELGSIGFLWVMWLATAGDTAAYGSCPSSAGSICSEFQAAEAFSFLTWLILMAYWILLLTFSIMAHMSGNHDVWMSAVSDVSFTSGGSAATQPATSYPAVPGEKPMHEIPVSYPPPQNV